MMTSVTESSRNAGMADVPYFVLVKQNAFCYIRKHQEKNSNRPSGHCHREQTDEVYHGENAFQSSEQFYTP
jgi:hypothetical protein